MICYSRKGIITDTNIFSLCNNIFYNVNRKFSNSLEICFIIISNFLDDLLLSHNCNESCLTIVSPRIVLLYKHYIYICKHYKIKYLSL
jgi:hypothetical protein